MKTLCLIVLYSVALSCKASSAHKCQNSNKQSLNAAIENGEIETVRTMLSKKPFHNLINKQYNNIYPIERVFAVLDSKQRYDLLLLLLHHDVDLHKPLSHGKTAFQIARHKKDIHAYHMMVEHDPQRLQAEIMWMCIEFFGIRSRL